MAENSKIEWTDATWNFVRGCSPVSEGCRNCYAETIAARFSGVDNEGKKLPYHGLAKMVNGEARWTGEIGFVEETLRQPLRWTRPRKIFVNSMSDLFHEKVTDEMLDKAFAVMALTPQHTYQVLTKRPERMAEYLLDTDMKRDAILDHIWTISKDRKEQDEVSGKVMMAFLNKTGLPNVWLGTSVEDQKTADERIPHLLKTPAAVRFLSIEPLLGPVDLERWLSYTPDCDCVGGHDHDCTAQAKIDWVIVGGESGPNARPCHPDWVRSIRDQCQAAGVPFFFKQWGEWAPLVHQMPSIPKHQVVPFDATESRDAYRMFRVGKKKAGRILDGRTWDEFPEAQQ